MANDDFEQYARSIEDEYEQYIRAPEKKSKKNTQAELPWFIKAGLGALQSAQVPLKEAIPQRYEAVKRGLKDIPEGLQQLYHNDETYNKKLQAERQAYAETPAGQDPYAQLIREQISQLPYLLALGPAGKALKGIATAPPTRAEIAAGAKPTIAELKNWANPEIGELGKSNLLQNMLRMGGSLAGIRATQYVEPTQDRATEALKYGLLGAAIPLGAEAPRMAAGAIKGSIGLPGQLRRGEFLESPEAKALEAKIGPLAENKEQALMQKEKAAEENKLAEEESMREIGKINPNRLFYDVKNMQEGINNANVEIDRLHKALEENKKLPELPKIGTEHLENVKSSENAVNTVKDHITNIKRNIDSAGSGKIETQSQIGKLLNSGETHDVNAAILLNTAQDEVKAQGTQYFEDLEQQLEPINIPLENTRSINDVMSDITKLFVENKHQSPEANQLLAEMEAIQNGTAETGVRAIDALRYYRSARDYAYEARKNSYRPGMNAEERHEWELKADNLDQNVDKLRKFLREGIGKENSALLDKATNYWKENVIPLYKNKLWQKISFEKAGPDNILKELRKDSPGYEQIRRLVKSNPEIVRSILGQRYDAGEEKFFKPTKLKDEYLELLPEVKELYKQRNNFETLSRENKSSLKKAQQQEKEIKEIHTRNEKLAKEKESEKVAHAKEFERREKEHKDIETEIKEKSEKRDKLKSEIDKYKEQMKKLYEKRQNAKLTTKQYNNIVKEEKEMRKKIEDARKDYEKEKGTVMKLLITSKKIYKGLKIAGKLAGMV